MINLRSQDLEGGFEGIDFAGRLQPNSWSFFDDFGSQSGDLRRGLCSREGVVIGETSEETATPLLFFARFA